MQRKKTHKDNIIVPHVLTIDSTTITSACRQPVCHYAAPSY